MHRCPFSHRPIFQKHRLRQIRKHFPNRRLQGSAVHIGKLSNNRAAHIHQIFWRILYWGLSLFFILPHLLGYPIIKIRPRFILGTNCRFRVMNCKCYTYGTGNLRQNEMCEAVQYDPCPRTIWRLTRRCIADPFRNRHKLLSYHSYSHCLFIQILKCL